jgi:hypothetical protein
MNDTPDSMYETIRFAVVSAIREAYWIVRNRDDPDGEMRYVDMRGTVAATLRWVIENKPDFAPFTVREALREAADPLDGVAPSLNAAAECLAHSLTRFPGWDYERASAYVMAALTE